MITEDGWPSCGPDQLDYNPIPGTDEVAGLQRGQPNSVLKAFMADLNWYVESVYNGVRGSAQDEGGWTGTNSVPTSNHLGATAFDYNWRDHPMGPQVPDPAAGWQWSEITQGPEEPRVRDLLRYYTYKGLQLVWWANDWDSPHDSMHFQMGYGTFGDPRVQEFIDQCIRPDGFSRFRDDRGFPGVDVVATLAEAMGNTAGVDYGALQAAVSKCLQDCGCTTVERIAMWCAQIGTESAGLKYMEEIASGAEYEGRTNLGNTQLGDGVRFKGRGPIQVTGRHNYTVLSQWAFGKGLLPSPTYFVDLPHELASDRYGFIGVTWYWTTQRPMNDAADAKDVVTATHYVNGGEHGLQDRINRYNRCINMGQRLIALTNAGDEDEMAGWDQGKVERAMVLLENIAGVRRPSRSGFRWPGEGDVDTCAGFAWAADGNEHMDLIIKLADYGDPQALGQLMTVAACELPDRKKDAELAQRVLDKIKPSAGEKQAATAHVQSWLDAEKAV